jgi:hypothetical protein
MHAVILLVPLLVAVPSSPVSEATHSALWGPGAAPYGATVRLHGYLRDRTGATITGQTVLIQRSPRNAGRWTTLTTRRLSAGQATYAVDVRQTTAYDYRAHYPGSGRYAASTSRVAYPAVQWKVLFDSVRTVSHASGLLRATGRVYPAAGTTVYLQRYVGTSRSWKSIAAGRSSGGSVTIDARVGGSVLLYRLFVPGRYPYAAGASAVRSHQHFVWRGVFKRPLLAKGGTMNPQFNIVPAGEVPEQSEAELLADRTGSVWGDLNTSGCLVIRAWLGNLTDGTVRVSLRRGGTVLGAIDMRQETEAVLERRLAGSTRTTFTVTDRGSVHGPTLSTDTHVLCNN